MQASLWFSELKLSFMSVLGRLGEVHKEVSLLHANPTQKWKSIVKEQQEVSEPAAYFYTRMRCALEGARLLFWSGQCLELSFMLPRLGKKEEECCSWRGQLPENTLA